MLAKRINRDRRNEGEKEARAHTHTQQIKSQIKHSALFYVPDTESEEVRSKNDRCSATMTKTLHPVSCNYHLLDAAAAAAAAAGGIVVALFPLYLSLSLPPLVWCSACIFRNLR